MFFQRILCKAHMIVKPFSCVIKKYSSLSKAFNEHLLTATVNAIHTHRRNSFGRTALFASRWREGSLTLEAAIVLPFFTFVCIAFVFFCQVFYLHCEIQGSLFQAARYISGNFLYVQYAEDNHLLEDEAAQKIICVAAARQKMMEYSEDMLNDCVCLEGGSDGLQLMYSSISEEYVDLVVNYQVKLPYAFGLDATFPIVQRCRLRAWTGESGVSQLEDSEELVYITEYGTVYHNSADCTHLKLSVRQIQVAQLPSQRNDNGGKYKSCEKCVKDGKEEVVYITAEGDRYHNTLSCGGLKRTIQQVPISQIEGKSACTRCCK